MSKNSYKEVQGTDQPTNASADKTIISAPGADKRLIVTRVHIGVTTAAVGGGGLVALEDGVGGTRFAEVDADAVGTHVVDFGDVGYKLSENTLLNATVDSAATTQATARVTAVGYEV